MGRIPSRSPSGSPTQGAAWIHVVDLDRAFGDGENLARGAPHRGPGRVAGARAARRRTPDARARARGARAGGEPRRHRHGRGDRSGDRPAARWPPWARTASRSASTRGTAGWRSAGWTETSDLTAEALARRVAGEGVRTVIYTDVARDGMLTGPDLDGARRLQAAGVGVIASGGIAAADDIRAAREAGLAGAIVGPRAVRGAAHAGGGARGRRQAPASAMIFRAARRPGAARPPWPRSPISGSSGPAAAAGCRSPAARWPGARSVSCSSTSVVRSAGSAPAPAGAARRLAQPDRARAAAGPRPATRPRAGATCAASATSADPADYAPHARPLAARRPRSPPRGVGPVASSSSPTARSRTPATFLPSCLRPRRRAALPAGGPRPTWRSRA